MEINDEDRLNKYQEEDKRLRKEYDEYASQLPFWYLDALFSGATDNSSYRKKAIESLHLNSTSQILDIACGMGANFQLIEIYLKNTGKLVGLELSKNLLEWAKGKILKNNWNNIKLVNKSITEYNPGIQFDAIICTFAMEIIPDFKTTIRKIYELLKPNGRFTMIGMKLSSKFPFKILNQLFEKLYIKYDIDIHRNFISRFKSKSMKIEYYKDCHFGFEYILTLSKCE